MKEPFLYLSLYFKKHRQSYYDHLQIVRDIGDWEEWISFFLKGVIETSNQVVTTSQNILDLFANDKKSIKAIGKASGSMLVIHGYLEKHIISDSKAIAAQSSLTIPTINKSLDGLKKLGIVKEVTGKSRNKVYCYKKYLDILNNEY